MHTKKLFVAIVVLILLTLVFAMQRNNYLSWGDITDRDEGDVEIPTGEINPDTIHPTIEDTVQNGAMSSDEFIEFFSLTPEQLELFEGTPERVE